MNRRGAWVPFFHVSVLTIVITSLAACATQTPRTTDSRSPEAAALQAVSLEPSVPPPTEVTAAAVSDKPTPSIPQATKPSAVPQSVAKASKPVEHAPTVAPKPEDIWARIRAGFSLNEPDQPRIQRERAWFERHQAYLDRVATRGDRYMHYIVEEVARRGLPMELALLPIVESAFQPFAYSHGRASGIWQFIPGTGRRYGLKQNWWYDGRRDIAESTRAALDYLEKLHKEFNNDWLLAVAGYNCGEGNIRKAIRRNLRLGKKIDFWSLRLPRETRTYVPRLLAVAAIVGEPDKYGLNLKPVPNAPYFNAVELDGQIDLALAAELAEISLEELYLLNPAYNRWATDPAGPHRLLVPTDKAAGFASRLAQLEPEKRVRWERHRIRSGESLSTIARRYRTTADIIKQTNNLRSSRIRAGKSLIVPIAARSLTDYTLSADARGYRPPIRSSSKRRQYVVRKGDTLWEIARRNRVSVGTLARWNGISRGDPIRPGQKLLVRSKTPKTKALAVAATPSHGPSAATQTTQRIRYTVRRGDSLWNISRKFSVSIASLRRWNSINRGKHLQPGQKLDVFVDITGQAKTS